MVFFRSRYADFIYWNLARWPYSARYAGSRRNPPAARRRSSRVDPDSSRSVDLTAAKLTDNAHLADLARREAPEVPLGETWP